MKKLLLFSLFSVIIVSSLFLLIYFNSSQDVRSQPINDTSNEQLLQGNVPGNEVVQDVMGLTGVTIPITVGQGPGTGWYGYNIIGPGYGDVIFTSTGWNFYTYRPSVVICQPRQAENTDYGWPYQFVIQVIQTDYNFIKFRIRRIDDGTGSSSWRQDLRVDIFIVE